MRIINHLVSPFPYGDPRMERGRETKNFPFGDHKVFVTIRGLTYLRSYPMCQVGGRWQKLNSLHLVTIF